MSQRGDEMSSEASGSVETLTMAEDQHQGIRVESLPYHANLTAKKGFSTILEDSMYLYFCKCVCDYTTSNHIVSKLNRHISSVKYLT